MGKPRPRRTGRIHHEGAPRRRLARHPRRRRVGTGWHRGRCHDRLLDRVARWDGDEGRTRWRNAGPPRFGATSSSRIAVDATHAYWTNDGAIAKVALAGGTPVTFALTDGCVGIALDATHIYCTWRPPNVAVGTVMKLAIEDGTSVTLASAQKMPAGIAVDANNVYWTNHHAAGSVMQIAK